MPRWATGKVFIVGVNGVRLSVSVIEDTERVPTKNRLGMNTVGTGEVFLRVHTLIQGVRRFTKRENGTYDGIATMRRERNERRQAAQATRNP